MIKEALLGFSGHPVVTLSSYGLDGEAAALGEQIMAVLTSARIKVADQRASFISTGGFELGIQIRGPTSEREFMTALRMALTSIGRLKEVHVNGPSFRAAATIGGTATMGGAATMGGGGEVIVSSVPAIGPVSIMIGVKPLPVLIVK